MASKLKMIGDAIYELAGKARVEETIPLKRPNPVYDPKVTDKARPEAHEFENYTEHRVYELVTLTPEQLEEQHRQDPNVWQLRGQYETHDEAMVHATAIADQE